MREFSWHRTLLVGLVCLMNCTSGTTGCDHNDQTETMWSEQFLKSDTIQLVACKQSINFARIQLLTYNGSILVSYGKDTCTAPGSSFAACVKDETTVTLKVIVTDLEEGVPQFFNCNALCVETSSVTWTNRSINVSYTGPAAVTMPASTTEGTKNIAHSIYTGEEPIFPSSVVYIVLTLLAVLITVCCILCFTYFKGQRRKRRAGDCDAMSLRSGITDKSFITMGFRGPNFLEGGAVVGEPERFVRQLSVCSSGPPTGTAPEVPGNNRLVMQYQKPRDTVPERHMPHSDRIYVSSPCVQYQEPWGRTLDDPEILGRLTTLRSPNQHLVKIPDFDLASTSASPSAPPTQETTETLSQDNT